MEGGDGTSGRLVWWAYGVLVRYVVAVYPSCAFSRVTFASASSGSLCGRGLVVLRRRRRAPGGLFLSVGFYVFYCAFILKFAFPGHGFACSWLCAPVTVRSGSAAGVIVLRCTCRTAHGRGCVHAWWLAPVSTRAEELVV